MKRTLQSEENMQNLNETRHKFFLDLCYYCPKYLTREDIRDALLDMKKFAQKVKRMVNGFESVISRIKEEDKRSNTYQKYDLFINLLNQFEFSLEHLINDPMINSRETCLRFAKLSMRFLRDLNEFIVEVYTYEFTLVYSVPLSWKDAQKKGMEHICTCDKCSICDEIYVERRERNHPYHRPYQHFIQPTSTTTPLKTFCKELKVVVQELDNSSQSPSSSYRTPKTRPRIEF